MCMYTQHQWPAGNPVASTARTLLYKQVQSPKHCLWQ